MDDCTCFVHMIPIALKEDTDIFMNDITCISTDDLKNWTDHGEVFHAKDSRWGAQLTWAPCVVYHNNQFYLYYGDGNCGGIGVATSNSPTGPYIDNRDKPVVDMNTPGVQPGADNGECGVSIQAYG